MTRKRFWRGERIGGEVRIWDRRIWGGYEKKRAGILRLNKGVGYGLEGRGSV